MARRTPIAEYLFALLPAVLLVAGALLLGLVARDAPIGASGTLIGGRTDGAANERSLARALQDAGVSTDRLSALRGLTQEPDRASPITRIAFGSCFRQDLPSPIFASLAGANPDVVLLLGDNVYGDTRSGTIRELVGAYETARDHPDFAAIRSLPVVATWDDHDYGMNDGGADYALKATSAELFRAVWSVPDATPADGGIYRSVVLGEGARQVRLILLDTRTFRGPLTQKPADSDIFGKYVPSTTIDQQMLGEAQWSWLEDELAKPAALRVVVSSIQVLAEGHGWERWGNMPGEQARLLSMLEASGTDNLLLLSGDRHNGAVYERRGEQGTRLVEVTSSSFNRAFPNKDTPGPYRIGEPLGAENFGLISLDWEAGTATVALHDIDGEPVEPIVTVALSQQ